MNFLFILLATVLALAAFDCRMIWKLAPGRWPAKGTAVGLFLLWMGCAFACFFVLERIPVPAARALHGIGYAWFPFALYFGLFCLLGKAAAACRLLPGRFLHGNAAGFWSVAGAVALVMVLGGLQHHRKQRVEMTVETSKPLEKPLTLVLASDLHLGYHTPRAELARWVDLFNAENTDLVLLCGDTVDASLRPLDKDHLAAEFRRLRAPVWAVSGNHEFYGGMKNAQRFFDEAGIRLLTDEAVRFKGVDVIGRWDAFCHKRAPLEKLARGLDGFTLVLDHQPRDLEEAERAGVDFQFSGHTHHGQIWPVSWITDLRYEKAWGPHRRSATRYYVSSGMGIWGAKIRVGTRAEYLVLHLVPAATPAADRPPDGELGPF